MPAPKKNHNNSTAKTTVSGKKTKAATTTKKKTVAKKAPVAAQKVKKTVTTTQVKDTQAVCCSCKTNFLTTALLCFFLGAFGAHRFYTGHTNTGFAMLLLAVIGLFSMLSCCCPLAFLGTISGVWALVDFVIILCGKFKTACGKVVSY